MVNEKSLKNLQNFKDMDKDKLKELCRQGGIKSVEAKRRKRDLEYLIADKLEKALFKENEKGVTGLEALFDRVINGAKSGNYKEATAFMKQLFTFMKIIGIGETYEYTDIACGIRERIIYTDRWETPGNTDTK